MCLALASAAFAAFVVFSKEQHNHQPQVALVAGQNVGKPTQPSEVARNTRKESATVENQKSRSEEPKLQQQHEGDEKQRSSSQKNTWQVGVPIYGYPVPPPEKLVTQKPEPPTGLRVLSITPIINPLNQRVSGLEVTFTWDSVDGAVQYNLYTKQYDRGWVVCGGSRTTSATLRMPAFRREACGESPPSALFYVTALAQEEHGCRLDLPRPSLPYESAPSEILKVTYPDWSVID